MNKLTLTLLLLLLSAVSVFIGVKNVAPWDLFQLSEEQRHILLVSRLPRLFSLLMAGTSLGISGLIMQQLTRNKFVSPTTAGTDDAARLGILVAILMFGQASPLERMLMAFAFALLGIFVFMKILDRIRLKDVILIPLAGLMFGNIVGAGTTFLAYKHNLIQNMTAWLQGDFSTIMSGRYEMLYISLPLLAVAYLYADRFTISGMGEDFAVNLGLNHRLVVNIGLTIVALITAVVMITVGMIPFLGLVVPNLVSMYRGDHLKKSLFHTAVMGAIFILFCDILGRLLIYPYEIPIGLTVGVIGSGIFLYFLLRRRVYD